ncbi:Riboflavin transporter FmnP [Sporobacter termitidis DSM 10068]|uniref:Riboflavin transporter n=1 Tax=Sporobacter termitidis DSM 10068 TaxID=1123282 RepID=A0A1M5Z4U8_9FIRM|nr:ECF transporter S component [Sporobacter termitidis]SHI19211.1 Riboflavin transporter FmnP [Sporobacter termitidis DSM 10068]
MKFTTRNLVIMAFFIALSVVLVYLIHFPIFPAAAYLEYDPADIPILIGAFAFGPVAGILLTLVASGIQALTVSAASGLYGFLMHAIATSTLVVVASAIYRFRHTRAGAIIGLGCGTVAMSVVMVIANHFVTPLFLMVPASAVDPLLLPIIAPFNLIKAGINSTVTFLVYKSISKYIIHGSGFGAKKSADNKI